MPAKKKGKSGRVARTRPVIKELWKSIISLGQNKKHVQDPYAPKSPHLAFLLNPEHDPKENSPGHPLITSQRNWETQGRRPRREALGTEGFRAKGKLWKGCSCILSQGKPDATKRGSMEAEKSKKNRRKMMKTMETLGLPHFILFFCCLCCMWPPAHNSLLLKEKIKM